MIRNRCNIFRADGVIHTKNGGKNFDYAKISTRTVRSASAEETTFQYPLQMTKARILYC